MREEKAEKLYAMYSLVGELFILYPESVTEVLSFLIDAKSFIKLEEIIGLKKVFNKSM